MRMIVWHICSLAVLPVCERQCWNTIVMYWILNHTCMWSHSRLSHALDVIRIWQQKWLIVCGVFFISILTCYLSNSPCAGPIVKSWVKFYQVMHWELREKARRNASSYLPRRSPFFSNIINNVIPSVILWNPLSHTNNFGQITCPNCL
jgi:hypothetical protein